MSKNDAGRAAMTMSKEAGGARRASWSCLVWGAALASGMAGVATPITAWAAPQQRKPSVEELEGRYVRLRAEGKHAEAIPLAKRACSIIEAEFGSRSTRLAGCLDDLGILHDEQGAYAAAAAAYERALAIREEALGPSHLEVATTLQTLATAHRAQGRLEEAKALAERALVIHEEALGPDHPSVALDLNVLGLVHQDQGAYEAAEPLLERALSIEEAARGPDHPDVAIRLSNLATLHVRQGRYGTAEPMLKRALAIDEAALGPEHANVAIRLGNLAVLYNHLGRLEEAEPLLERAVTIHEKVLGPDHVNVALALNNLALLYQDQGAYERAEPMLERALAIFERSLGPAHPQVATVVNNLAALHREQQKYAEAEPLHLRALAIHEKALGPNHGSVATDLNGLALLYHDQDAYEKAEPLLKRALAIDENALGSRHPGVGISLNNLAMLYKDQGAYDEAAPLLERALTILEDALGPQHPRVATALQNLASLYYVQGRRDSALELYHRALDIEERHLTRNLLVAEESRRLAYVTTLAKRTRHRLSLHLRAAPSHRPTAALALTTLLRRKGRTLDLIAQSNVDLRRSLPDEGRRLLDELSAVNARYSMLEGRGPGSLTIEEFAGQLDVLAAKQDELWNALAEHGSAVRVLDRPVTIEEVQGALPSSSVLVELVRYVAQHDDAGNALRRREVAPPRYAAYLVFPDRFDWVDLGPADAIDRHVAAFRRALQLQQAVPSDLYVTVMAPIVARLRNADRLIIAPDGALNLVPFGALHDGERYLVERYALRYVTTGRDLLDRPDSTRDTTPVAVVANPSGAELPAADLEADVLAGLFPDARVLRHDHATETRVRTLERPLVLHMATHGFFGAARHERDNPMLRSGLHLADVTRVDVDRELDDGRLTAYEISGWDLRGTQLVVLSACETGMGEVEPGEGVLGLRRAFAMAGAQTQVMSLWQVGDVAALETMKAYYRELAAGRGRGEAMQAVQLELLRSEDRRHPHDWAAFIVTGDDAPMRFGPGQAPRVVEEAPPASDEGAGCCASTRRSGRRAPTAPLLVAFLGLGALRRRRA